MSNLWLDRPWWKRGLLYHLYLVILKDNGIRALRAGRWLRVNARIALRVIVRYLSGRSALVPQIVDSEKFYSQMIDRQLAQRRFLIERERSNRSLLTGMVVALIAGHQQFLTGWQRYKYAATRHSGYKTMLATRIIGRPSVMKYPNLVKVGLTEWHQDYTPRREALAAKGRRKYQ